MDEQNKTPAPKPNQPEKKLSRTTLTFYIVGLFSVALALILISYVAQERADKQLESLNSQLSEQQTVAQGATQKMEDLQKQFDEQQQVIESIRTALNSDEAKTDVVGAVKQTVEEREVYELLASINMCLYSDNFSDAQRLYKELTDKYAEERLLGNAKEGSFPSDVNKMFEVLKAEMEAPQDKSADENT